MKTILVLLVISLFLVSCASISEIDASAISGWDNLGDGLYRKIDTQLNVACYYVITSSEFGVAFACVSIAK
jgi:hypothetical protein